MSITLHVLRWVFAVVSLLSLGVFVGAGVMLVFDAAYWVMNAVWIMGWSACATPLYPLVVCTAAGVLISLVVTRFGKPARPVEQLQASKRHDSAASRSTARPFAVRIADFLLPFAGGGPVGVIMGVLGFAARGGKWVGKKAKGLCRSLGLTSKALPKGQKALLYGAAAAGALAGVAAVVELFGVGMVLPYVDGADLSVEGVLLAVPLAVAGWCLGLVYLSVSRATRRLWESVGHRRWALPLAGGIALGVSMAFFPHVGLPGSDAFSAQLLEEWATLVPVALVLTALLRTLLVAFLLNAGWSGGPFMPLVFGAVCMALGVAGLTGLAPGLCVAAMAGGLLVSFSGRPLLGVLALLFCPVENAPALAVAIAVAALLPKPKGLEGDFAKHANNQVKSA